MSIEECAKKEGEITLFYNSDDNLWYWEINDGGFGQIGASNGYYNPNTAKLELIEFLKTWNGFDR